MFGSNLKHSLATVAVAAAVLAAAGSASAATHPSSLIVYNGHAGLGAAVSQHQGPGAAGVTDGTSNTIMFARAPH